MTSFELFAGMFSETFDERREQWFLLHNITEVFQPAKQF